MTYTRKMKDWSEKVYYTEDEFFSIFDEKILKSANELISEIREINKDKEKNIRSEIKFNQLQYV